MSTEIDAEIVATCEAAVTRLSEHGLGRGSFINTVGQPCTAGALLLSWGPLDSHDSIMRALQGCSAIPAVAAEVCERFPSRVGTRAVEMLAHDRAIAGGVIYGFNDHPATTKDDVIYVLQETIKRHTPDAYTSTPEETP